LCARVRAYTCYMHAAACDHVHMHARTLLLCVLEVLSVLMMPRQRLCTRSLGTHIFM
jgi:hypothetical protein